MATTRVVYSWLEERLPQLDENWWAALVLPALSYQQQGHVERNGITSLDKLDLATLLRVMDKNWYELSRRFKFGTQDRNYLKELQTVRNRWAHLDTQTPAPDDVYRDADTMQRVVEMLGGDEVLLAKIKSSKALLREGVAASKSADVLTASAQAVSLPTPQKDDTFPNGCKVALKSDPAKRGVVMGRIPGGPEPRYTVFIEGEDQQLYASQLSAVVPEDTPRFVPAEMARVLLTAQQIRHPSANALFSLNAARIEFIPYQFRPVLKIIRSDRPRILVADGVGVGKTIEAGLILRELQARSDIRSVLIICPKPLVAERKWEQEMRRFDEQFTALDGGTLRFCLDELEKEGEWPERHAKTILPYSLLDETLVYGGKKGKKKVKGLLQADPSPKFDLVIVDEAQHIRNANTFAHQAVSFFCDHADAVVFLTATPIILKTAVEFAGHGISTSN